MRKFVRQIFLFLLFLVPAYVVLVVLWSALAPFGALKKNAPYPVGSYLGKQIQELDTISRVDILFLGSSHAFRTFDTRLYESMGLKAFNLGSASQTPLQTRWLVDRYIEKLSPRLVIYELYPATFENDGAEAAVDLMANTSTSNGMLDMAWKVNELKVYNTYIYDQFRELRGAGTGGAISGVQGTDTYISGGYVETSIKANEEPINEAMKRSYGGKTWNIREANWQAFTEILNELEGKEIPFMLVRAPVTSEAYGLRTDNPRVDRLFSDQGLFFNLNESMNLDDTVDFMDYHHLNQSGVSKVNKVMIELLKTHYPKIIKP